MRSPLRGHPEPLVPHAGRQGAEHWANRDNLGMGQQLGWTLPTPAYIVRMLLAKRRMRRAAGA
jgi:hypothetical protein